MHDSIHEDAIIWVKPPAGKFVLDVYSPKPAVLISNGVGITPMIAMAKAVILPQSIATDLVLAWSQRWQ